MSKKQTRRSVSLSASMFARLAAHAHDTGKPLSQIVETWIEENTSGAISLAAISERVQVPQAAMSTTRQPATRHPNIPRPAVAPERPRAVVQSAPAGLRAELPSRAKVARVEAPKPARVEPRKGVPGAF